MSCEFRPSSYFAKEAKKLSKRYRSFKQDLQNFLAGLEADPMQGVDLGGGLRKVRMKITDKGCGKSGGARVITMNVVVNTDHDVIALVMIYDKSDSGNVKDNVLKKIVKDMGL